MVLIEDSRQQWRKHENIAEYCKRKNIKVVRKCLNVGDYMLEGNDKVSVDTKESVLELARNVMSRDHERFRRECIRAQQQGIQLIVLIEEALPDGKLVNWKSPRYERTTRWHSAGERISNINPESLRKALVTMQKEYGVKFRFCDPRSTGKQLFEYLRGERK